MAEIRKGLHIVSLFEGAKGLLVLLVGFALLELIHKDLHEVAEQIVRNIHLNPARHYPRIFIDAASHMTDGKLLGNGIFSFGLLSDSLRRSHCFMDASTVG
jgi:hypothetical protein